MIGRVSKSEIQKQFVRNFVIKTVPLFTSGGYEVCNDPPSKGDSEVFVPINPEKGTFSMRLSKRSTKYQKKA